MKRRMNVLVSAKDKVVGHNVISRIHGGCALLEEYQATGGVFEGKSFNYFDSTDGHYRHPADNLPGEAE